MREVYEVAGGVATRMIGVVATGVGRRKVCDTHEDAMKVLAERETDGIYIVEHGVNPWEPEDAKYYVSFARCRPVGERVHPGEWRGGVLALGPAVDRSVAVANGAYAGRKRYGVRICQGESCPHCGTTA